MDQFLNDTIANRQVPMITNADCMEKFDVVGCVTRSVEEVS